METLTTGLYWLLWMPLVFLLFMYVAGPLIVWRLQRSPAEFKFLRLKDNSILNMISPLCEERDKALRKAGFHLAGSASMMMGNGQTYFSAYRSPEQIMALLIAMKGGDKHLTYVEFIRQQADQSVTIVSNSSMGSVFPDSARKRNLRFPEVEDIRELLALAQKIFTRLHADMPVQAFPAGKELEAIEQFLQRESEALVERGWYRPVVVDGYRRLSLQGAFAMTWRLLWPMRQLLQRRARKAADKIREEAEALV